MERIIIFVVVTMFVIVVFLAILSLFEIVKEDKRKYDEYLQVRVKRDKEDYERTIKGLAEWKPSAPTDVVLACGCFDSTKGQWLYSCWLNDNIRHDAWENYRYRLHCHKRSNL